MYQRAHQLNGKPALYGISFRLLRTIGRAKLWNACYLSIQFRCLLNISKLKTKKEELKNISSPYYR
jgi:hypothetical protein